MKMLMLWLAIVLLSTSAEGREITNEERNDPGRMKSLLAKNPDADLDGSGTLTLDEWRAFRSGRTEVSAKSESKPAAREVVEAPTPQPEPAEPALWRPEYFVAPGGDDDGDGSFEKPFRSIEKGASMLRPGATLYLRGGRYHQETRLEAIRGDETAPVTIRPYGKEKAVLDGTVELKGLDWSKHERYPNVWQAEIDRDVWQLFVDGRMMINARWPNAEHPFENEERSSWWDRGRSWCHVQYKIDEEVVSGFDFERGVGFLVEDGVKDMAGAGRSFAGSMGVLNVNSMNTLVGRISKHEAGSAAFEYEVNEQLRQDVRNPNQNNLRRILTKNASHAYFYLEGWADMIDTPDEWAYDKETRRLFLYAASADELKGRKIRGKDVTVALRLQDCEYVAVKGLEFFGAALQTYDCFDVVVEDNTFDYPSYSKRMLGSLEDIETIAMMMTEEGRRGQKRRARPKEFLAGLKPEESMTNLPRAAVAPADGTYNVFRNNIVRHTDGMAIHLSDGAYDVIDNNLFRFIDISGTPGGSVGVTFNGWRNTFSRNTIEICCSSKATKAGAAGLTILNRVNRFGYLQDDGTAFQASGQGQQGTIYTQNWVHDSVKSGLRFDGSEHGDAYAKGIFNGTMARNVVFRNNCGLMVKGDDHRVYNNLCYNTQNDAYKILTSAESPHSNHDTITRNNIGDYVNASRRDDPTENPPPGRTDHNWVNLYPQRDVRELLRDPDNLDFRPRAGATEIIDAGVDIPSEQLRSGVVIPDFTTEFKIGKAPDVGAYEFGAKDYWIAGYRGPKAGTPIPPDGTTTAKSDADLMWLPAYRAVSFKVYLGTDRDELRLVAEQENNIHDPGPLDPTAVYYWRIDCKTPDGWSEGDVWSFRARGRPFRRGGALPSSHVEAFEEVYDFDPQNLEKNLQGLIMPWIHPKFNGDHLDIRGGVMEIIPDGNRTHEFEAITIPNTNIDLERYPFVSFKYRTVDRRRPISFYAGYTVFGGKARDAFPDKPLAVLKPIPGKFTPVFLDLTSLVDQGKELFGSAIAKNFLLQITGPEDVPWRKENGAFLISDFRIGFACLLDKAEKVAIAGQRHRIESSGQPVILGHEDLEITVSVRGDTKTYAFPANDPLPPDWNLRLAPGDSYTVVDGDIIKPASDFEGTLRVSASIEAGGKSSPPRAIEVIVKR
jgi:hypothetical protein